MVTNQLLTLLVLFVIAAAFGATVSSSSRGNGCGRSLGVSEDGVEYILNNTIEMTWYEARDYCSSCGYELATVRTRAQTQWLYRTLGNGQDHPAVWIAARENRKTLKYLNWDKDETDIEDGVFDYYMDPLYGVRSFVCAQFEVKYDYQDVWIVLRVCEKTQKTLCMTYRGTKQQTNNGTSI